MALTITQTFQLDLDIRAAGIPIIGVSMGDGTRNAIEIKFDNATAEQQTAAWVIVDGYFI